MTGEFWEPLKIDGRSFFIIGAHQVAEFTPFPRFFFSVSIKFYVLVGWGSLACIYLVVSSQLLGSKYLYSFFE
jgi:hypothetical protein